MGTQVSIKRMIAAMDLPCPTWESYLDPETGEIVTITDEHRTGLANRIGETQERDLVREALESDHFLMLPDQYEIHEWSIMQHFALTQRNADIRHELLGGLHGREPYRTFCDSVERWDLELAWADFRERALEEIARGWLRHHGIPYR
ncbi:MAG: UPF0158 family protein [Xanthomonadales bacterium]|nr:UPF0158 family protein [Xanthomonadales bacterium]